MHHRTGYMAKIEPEFTKRNCKLIGLSVDPVDNHKSWAKDIEETQGYLPRYPMIRVGAPACRVIGRLRDYRRLVGWPDRMP